MSYPRAVKVTDRWPDAEGYLNKGRVNIPTDARGGWPESQRVLVAASCCADAIHPKDLILCRDKLCRNKALPPCGGRGVGGGTARSQRSSGAKT
jgi:hypothetical protein